MKVRETAEKFLNTKNTFTYRDYLNLPPDDSRYQLIEGELIMTPSPKIIHQEISKILVLKLVEYAEKRNKGKIYFAPCDVYLDDYNVVQPDIFFVSNARRHIITEDNIKGAPDLIVEILSPSSAYYDLIAKKELYEKFGVKEYWIVDPMRHWIELYSLQNGKYALDQRLVEQGILNSVILKDFKLNIEEIFKD